MKSGKYKSKRFLLPILSLVLISITLIAIINTYLTIKMFNFHMTEHIDETKKEYTQKHKNRVFKDVNFVNDSIKFQITTIENKLKVALKEKIFVALDIANFIYDTYKDKLNKEQIKEKISQALSVIKFNDNRGYYFMYDNKTKVIFGHPLKKFIGRDMTNFRDIRGQSLMELDATALKKSKIGYSKIYFNKPNNQNDEFPKITCITKFEPLDLVLGIGEYLDVVEKQTKKYVLERFKVINDNKKYLFILDVHDIEGGDEFATVLINSNRSELVGKKVSDKTKDVKGNRFRKNFLTLIKKDGAGYSQYWYKKPSTKTASLKISYIHFQKQWNWIIGSGFYYDDLEKQITAMKESITTHTQDMINKTIIWVVILSLIAIFIAIFVSFRIDKTIKNYTNTIVDYENNKREQDNLLIQQSKLASMGEMLSNIAHQWRQPLSTISTAATGTKLQKEMNCLSDEQLNSALEAINGSAQYLSHTIEDFRNFFDPNKVNVEEFNVEDLIDKSLKLVESQFKLNSIELIKDIKSNQLKSIANEIMQVLINILNNARDALELNNENIRLIFVKSYKKDNNIYIEILDNAGGIKEEIIDKIFEPYFTTKHQSQGTGIGLYMSQDIIKKHLNGTLEVDNETYIYDNIEYKGAKFTIKIRVN